MRVTIIFLLHFLLAKWNNIIFNSQNFLFDAGQNATFSLLNYLWLKQFFHTQIGNFPDDLTPLNRIHHFNTPKYATFMAIFCFWTSDIIFTPRKASFQTIVFLEQDAHWERQVSRRLYFLNKCTLRKASFQMIVFLEQDANRERQVSRRLYFLNKMLNFYHVGILHFPGTLPKKKKRKRKWFYQLMQHTFLGQKQQKFKNRQKSTYKKFHDYDDRWVW